MTNQNDSSKGGIQRRTSLLFKAALLLLPIIGGYFLISSMLAKNQAPVGHPNPIARKYGLENLSNVYPDMDVKEIDQLLTDAWSRTLAYETFTQFKEHSHTSKYVNIDTNGFRVIKNQGPWPLSSDYFNVFVFGGSVTFGYGARDDQTVPSYLQELLNRTLSDRVRIYNFGRGHYYSLQEMTLYQQLLLKEFIPDMALFIDGSNDFYYANNKALFSKKLETMTTRMLTPEDIPKEEKEPDIYPVADRYSASKKMIEAISSVYAVRTVFAWHPISLYKYDLSYHLFGKESFADHSWANPAYRYMSSFVKDHPPGNNFIWCADIQEDSTEPLYVDRFHYTARLAKMTASCIGNNMLNRGLIDTEVAARKK